MRDDGWMIPESTIIVEYLDSQFDQGPRLIPQDKELARRARFFDRQFDLYVNEPARTIFLDGRKPEADRSPSAVAANGVLSPSTKMRYAAGSPARRSHARAISSGSSRSQRRRSPWSAGT